MQIRSLAVLAGLTASHLFAGTLQVQVASLGSNSFRLIYTLSGLSLAANQELDILFDPNVYRNLQNPQTSSGLNALLIQPNNPPGAPGHLSVLALNSVNSGSFSVDVTYLLAGSPPAQAFFTDQLDSTGQIQAATLASGANLVSVETPAFQPAIMSLLPNPLPAKKSTAVTITGINFQDGMTVAVSTDVGTVPVSGLTIKNSEVQLNVTLPGDSPVPPYVGHIVLTNPNGLTTKGYFLVSPPGLQSIVVPRFATGGGVVTGFYIFNRSNQPAQFSMDFNDAFGNRISVPFNGMGNVAPLRDTIPANGAKYYETASTSGVVIEGSASVSADPSIQLQGLFRRQAPDGTYSEAALVSMSGAKELRLTFDATTFTPSGDLINTGLALTNLESTQVAKVTCTARDSAGNIIPNAVPVPSTIDPLGTWSGYLFPALRGMRGTLDCTANTLIAGVDLRALGNSISTLPVLALAGNPSSNNPVLPQIAAGNGITTGFYVLNTSAQAANFSISFHDKSGNPLILAFSDSTSKGTLTDTIPPGGAKYYETSSLPSDPAAEGSGTITADPGIIVQALFRRLGSDGKYYEAAVPSDYGSFAFQTLFDATDSAENGTQMQTGLAITNLDSRTTGNVSCTAWDSSGNPIPLAISVGSLPPLGHWSAFNFPALAGKRGTVQCSSNTSIAGIAIRALGNAISTLPVFALDSLPVN